MKERYHVTTQNRFYPDMSKVNKNITMEAKLISPPTCIYLYIYIYIYMPRWWLHLIVVKRSEYASDPESYTSSSVATGRASLAGQVKG